MKHYLLTEDELDSFAMQWLKASDKAQFELPPGGKWLTKSDVALWISQVGLDYHLSPSGEKRVLDELFG